MQDASNNPRQYYRTWFPLLLRLLVDHPRVIPALPRLLKQPRCITNNQSHCMYMHRTYLLPPCQRNGAKPYGVQNPGMDQVLSSSRRTVEIEPLRSPKNILQSNLAVVLLRPFRRSPFSISAQLFER